MVVNGVESAGSVVMSRSVRAGRGAVEREGESTRHSAGVEAGVAAALAFGVRVSSVSAVPDRFEPAEKSRYGLGRKTEATSGFGATEAAGDSRIAGATRDAREAAMEGHRSESRAKGQPAGRAVRSEAGGRDSGRDATRASLNTTSARSDGSAAGGVEQSGETAPPRIREAHPSLLGGRPVRTAGPHDDGAAVLPKAADGAAGEAATAATNVTRTGGETASPGAATVRAAVRSGGVGGPSSGRQDAGTPVRGKDAPADGEGRATRTAKGRAASSPPARPAEMIERIAKVIRASANANQTVAHLRLDPPELGQVRVRLQIDGDALRLRMTADRAEGHDQLTTHSDQLRSALEQQGLRVERIDFGSRPEANDSHAAVYGDGGSQGAMENRNADGDGTRDRTGDGRSGALENRDRPGVFDGADSGELVNGIVSRNGMTGIDVVG
ncbi:MAG: flagellar hook-length control protein FliK [Phycisphaerales bacterium]|nr:flagellar hook-length control protein FliK [Phycisphaerales bacterium]